MREIGIVIAFLVALFLLWVYVGGPENESAQDKFITPIDYSGGGQTYDEEIFTNEPPIKFQKSE